VPVRGATADSIKYGFTMGIQGRYRKCERCDFARSICLIYIKSRNVIKKSGEKSELSNSQYCH